MGYNVTLEEERADVARLMVGWTVVAVQPPRGSETFFNLVLERGGVTRVLEVGGTELGYWVIEVRERKPRKTVKK